MKKVEKKPSPIALAFFHWFCQPQFREEIEGDLLERFHSYSEKYGYNKANRLFIRDVISLFRPTLIKNINQIINTETMMITRQNKRLVTILVTAGALLFIPLIAMNFTNEVNWKVFDFIVAGILLFGAGITLEFILRNIKSQQNRIFLIIGLFLGLMLIWAELAVGILGTVIAGS